MTHPRTSQGTACRGRFPFDHLSLAEIELREEMARWRSKMVAAMVVMTADEIAAWRAVNRVPRRPPIYDEPPKGAA